MVLQQEFGNILSVGCTLFYFYFSQVTNSKHIWNNKKKVNIIKPKVGEKQKHIKLAEKNATENIKLKKASLESHQNALERLKEFLLLDQLPSRIEVYDNSHTFGKESVGVMIVIDQEGFSSKNYRILFKLFTQCE